MANDVLFPCRECAGSGKVEITYSVAIRAAAAETRTCSLCKGTGKSERQLMLDILGALMLVVDLIQHKEELVKVKGDIVRGLQPPKPSPVPGRRDVVYGPSPRDQVIGPGLRKKQETPFPTLTEADKADLRARMDVARAERAKEGKR